MAVSLISSNFSGYEKTSPSTGTGCSVLGNSNLLSFSNDSASLSPAAQSIPPMDMSAMAPAPPPPGPSLDYTA